MAGTGKNDYIPSLPASLVAAILFGILLAIHLFRFIHTRTWFCLPNIIGTLCTSKQSTIPGASNTLEQSN